MDEQTRRQFMKRGLALLAAPGLASGFAASCEGCGRHGKTISPLKQGRGKEMKSRDSKNPAGSRAGFEPAYLSLHRSGELKRRGEELWKIMESCKLCPRRCEVDRIKGEKGVCGATAQLEISSFNPHFGEERTLVGDGGSGTIFMTHCGLRCVFCINSEISQGGEGAARTVEEMAGMMLKLQAIGCLNINFVTPTHYSPHIVLAIDEACRRGVRLPIVYNTCGWERVEILKAFDGIVDIYLPDYKYSDGKMAAKFSSNAKSYPEMTQAALLEMHRQVGVAKPAGDGKIYRGLMIRHLVMPNGVSGTKKVLEWIAANLPKDTYVNLMSQYRPMYKAFDYPEIARRLNSKEYGEAVSAAKALGLTNLDIQGFFGWW